MHEGPSSALSTLRPTATAERVGSVVAKAAYALAFMSGVAALVYEVTWVKMLSLTFGSTTLAASAVVAGYMAGMGIGARCYDLAYRRYPQPFKLYAGLELGIAVSTALVTLTFYWLPGAYASIDAEVGTGWVLAGVQFLSVFVLLFVPSALMGATYPALCTALIRSRLGLTVHLGMVYGLNTLGAAAGAVAAGIVLIEALGCRNSVYAANVVNVGVACGALLLAWAAGGGSSSPVPPTEVHGAEADHDAPITTALPRWVIGAVLLLSGFATLAYEMLWLRALKYLVGNSTYALTMVLVVFLVGLGFGGVWYRRVVERLGAEAALALCQIGIAVAALTAIGLEALAAGSEQIARYVSEVSPVVNALPWPIRLAFSCVQATIMMLPPTLLMGLSFPLASRLFVARISRVGAHLGGAYLLANIGSIVGVTAGAVVLLPALGSAGGTKAVALLNLLLGVGVLMWVGRSARYKAACVLGGVVPVAVLCFVLPGRLPYRGERETSACSVLYWTEGDISTVKVFDEPDGGRRMSIDGYIIASAMDYADNFSMKHKLLAHLPMALSPSIKRTLTVGLGSGASMQALAVYPDVEVLDCVEISQEVAEAARYFPEGAVLEDPRARLVVDDAVHFLRRSRAAYDLIVSDGKQNVRYSGNAALLSAEFYRLCLEHLGPDGIMIQWIPLGVSPASFKVTLRTFCEVFPAVEVYYFMPLSMLMIGSERPLPAERAPGSLAFDSPEIRRQLAPYLVFDAGDLLSKRVADGEQLRAVVGGGPVNTWDRPALEFIDYKARARHRYESPHANLSLLERAKSFPTSLPRPVRDGYLRRLAEAAGQIRRGYIAAFRAGKPRAAAPFFRRAEEICPERPVPEIPGLDDR